MPRCRRPTARRRAGQVGGFRRPPSGRYAQATRALGPARSRPGRRRRVAGDPGRVPPSRCRKPARVGWLRRPSPPAPDRADAITAAPLVRSGDEVATMVRVGPVVAQGRATALEDGALGAIVRVQTRSGGCADVSAGESDLPDERASSVSPSPVSSPSRRSPAPPTRPREEPDERVASHAAAERCLRRPYTRWSRRGAPPAPATGHRSTGSRTWASIDAPDPSTTRRSASRTSKVRAPPTPRSTRTRRPRPE